MANKDTENKKVEGTVEEAEKNTEEKKDEATKKKEADKEWAIIRWAKAIGQGVSNTAKAVNGFVHRHPYLTATVSAAAGYGGKMLVDHFTGNDSEEVYEPSEVLSLPEPEDDEYVDEGVGVEETEDNVTNVD